MGEVASDGVAADLADSGTGRATSADVAKPWPPARYGWLAVALMSFATTLNFIDTQIFTMMIELIKRDLRLSDVELGILLGPAGVIFYIFVGIPLARLADIYPRKIVLAIGMVLTGGFSAMGGFTQNYAQLFASRMFVGVGGSAHAPASLSLVADSFPPSRLPRAIAGMQLSFVLAMSISGFLGGWLTSWVADWQPYQLGPLRVFGWQWVLILTGLPTLLTAGFFLLLKEPPRRGRAIGAKSMPLREVFRAVHARRKIYYPMFIGLALASIEVQGVLQWRVPFMMRTYDWSPAQIGAWMGSMTLVTFPLGIFIGTALTERLSLRHKDAAVRTTAIAMVTSLPFAIASPLMPSGELALIMSGLSTLCAGAGSVPQNAAIQTITPNEMRAQLTAIHLFFMTAFGALGSLVVGVVTQYVLGDEKMLWLSIFIVVAALYPLAAFSVSRAIKPYGLEIEKLEAEGKL